MTHHNTKVIFLVGLLVLLLIPWLTPLPVAAQTADEPPAGAFGSFESGLFKGSIQKKAWETNALVSFIDLIIKIVRGVVIAVGLIAVVVGGYRYMTAGGDSSKVSEAKLIMGGALLGIILAILGQVLLDTISPQFSGDVVEPKLQLPTF